MFLDVFANGFALGGQLGFLEFLSCDFTGS